MTMRQSHAGDALSLFYGVLLELCRDAEAEFEALTSRVPGNSALAILVRLFRRLPRRQRRPSSFSARATSSISIASARSWSTLSNAAALPRSSTFS
jgi:hypothetical protein